MKKATTPKQSGWLAVGQGHEVFWQEFGNRKGIPLLFLHGGPGCGFDPGYLKLFDLRKIRLITFDQRGCGSSRPLGCLRANTTWHLVEDIEKIRTHLNIPQWFITGHSWGTTLALLYAAKNQSKIRGIVLAGFFSARRDDHIWCLSGVKTYFPEIYETLLNSLNIKARKNIDFELARRMKNGTTKERQKIAKALSNYFRQLTSLAPPPAKKGPISFKRLAMWDVFFHYALNNFYLDAKTGVYPFVCFTGIPVSLVHGRFDMDCRPEQAFRLKGFLPRLRLKIVTGNHDLEEEPMATMYKAALKEMMMCDED